MTEDIRQKLLDTLNEDKWSLCSVVTWKDTSEDEFETIDQRFVEVSRWSIMYTVITRHNPTGKLFSWPYDAPATEMQEGQDDYPLTITDITEVVPVERMVTKYVPAD